MSLKVKIQGDIKNALHSKDALVVSVLRMVMATLHNKEIEKKEKFRRAGGKTEEDTQKEGELSDAEINEILFSEVKKRKESIEQFRKGGRQDLVDKEEKELEILKQYLPEQLPEKELRKLIEETIKKVKGEIKDPSASSGQIMGKVMREIMSKVKGKADGGLVNNIVKELLISE